MTVTSLNTEQLKTLSDVVFPAAREESAIMKVTPQQVVGDFGTAIPTITTDPEADWQTTEDSDKLVSSVGLENKYLTPHVVAGIIRIPEKLWSTDLTPALKTELTESFTRAISKTFDKTVYGFKAAPSANFETLANAPETTLTTNNFYKQLVAAKSAIAVNGGYANALILSPLGEALLMEETDQMGRPLFVNSVTEGGGVSFNGIPVVVSRALQENSDNVIGYMGDFSLARYGTGGLISVKASDEASVNEGGVQINAFQRDQLFIRYEAALDFTYKNINNFIKLKTS